MITIISSVLVALFPYLPFFLLANNVQIFLVLICTGVLFAFSVMACILNFIFFKRNKWSAKALSLMGMIVKLIHIPAYIFLFMIGVSGVVFIPFIAVTLLIVFFDSITIALSGAIVFLAILRARKEYKIKTVPMLIFSVCSFSFCIDVIFSVILYFYLKNLEKQIS